MKPYTKEYYRIINFRKQNPLSENTYGEKHHIQPKSLGGKDSQDNLIKLLPEEHYKVHCLLPYVMLENNDINGYHRMLYAWRSFSTYNKDNPLYEIDKNAEEYGRLRREYIAMLKSTHRPCSDETKQKISIANTGKRRDKKQRAFISRKTKEAMKKVPKELISPWKGKHSAVLGRIWITDGINRRRIPKEDPIPDGWWKGVPSGQRSTTE